MAEKVDIASLIAPLRKDNPRLYEAIIALDRRSSSEETVQTVIRRIGGGSSGSVALVNAAIASGVLATDAEESGYLNISRYVANMLSIQSDTAAFLVLYDSFEAMEADDRDLPTTYDPDTASGVLAEFAFEGGDYYDVSPPILLYGKTIAELPSRFVYYRLMNLAASGQITITIRAVGLV